MFYRDFIDLKDVDAKPENINHKFTVLNNVSKLYNDLTKEYKHFYEREPKDDKNNNWKQKCDPKNLKDLEYQPVKSNIKSLPDEDKSDQLQLKLKQVQPNKVQKPLWVELSNENLDDDNYETTVNNHRYDLRNAGKFLLEVTTRKTSKNEAYELYNDLIKGDIAALTKAKSRGKDKRENILRIPQNLELVFTGVYLHYDSTPKSESESEFEESIAKRNKLRRQRFDEIAKNEKEINLKLFRKYFGYLNPSNMYKALNETKSLEKNKAKVNLIENSLVNLMVVLKDTPKSDANKIAGNNKVVDIVERILYFNNKNKKRQGIKILTPNQMLNR